MPGTLGEQYRAFWDAAQANPDATPRTSLGSHFRLADAGNVLTVTYSFSAEGGRFPRDARPWAENGWNRANLDDARRAEVERLKAWAQGARPLIQSAFQRGAAAALLAFN